jgi:hypothetical protein
MLDFLGIGAQKTGTTWLHEALAAHPAVRFPGGKEIHFWDWHRARGVDWYRSLFGDSTPGVKSGEITPAYALLPAAAFHEILEINPALRVVYTLRNPIERAWSAALMVMQRGGMTIDEASDQWFIDHFRSKASRLRGDYEGCLRSWRGVIGERQLLVLRYEALCEDPRAYLEACCLHIGVDPGFYGPQHEEMLRRRVYASVQEPLRESLRPVLEEIYTAKIRSLSVYLGADLSAWLEPRRA